ncbi:polyprenyl synthetase family protein [Ruegeria faecimaris]|uniref:Geranylgeranyl diphosphate synthase, type II n=1 Tax=Ruegeria faecimaris TaxID=686389 RepID=A0A521E9D4_9RHOB|nr:polyprenyl synthetase family protein [Ruegeria faecimaris]SMO80372.1 geranylgeranyl diphosphate synthase, type II [Ruegeria faecimaris]
MTVPKAQPASAATQGFLEQLTRYGDQARKVLLDKMPTGEPQAYLYGPMRDYIETSGKGLRPALLLATCEAFGGKAEDAEIAAAVIELLHNAFLVHDDIEDLSDFRRGRECMHKRLGVPLAINIGDGMQSLALSLLRQNLGPLGPMTGARVVDEFDHLLKESIEGQALELGWIKDNRLDLSPSDYLTMCLKKTCWYSFIHPMRIGALIARPDDVASGALNLDDFNAFGFFLGAAFQIQDDVLNLVGSQGKYGKEIGGDIYEGKRTLMLGRLGAQADRQEQSRLSEFLEKPRTARSEQEVEWVLARMNHYSCIEYAQAAANDLLAAARREFDVVFANTNAAPRAFLGQFMDYLVARQV